jgi:hypothetical protein
MAPAPTFCPNLDCPARGQAGQGHSRLHSCQDQRFRCTEGPQRFSATTGTALYRLRTSAETMSLGVPLMAHGCARHARVVAFGHDARTGAGWLARAGVQGPAVQAPLGEPPRALGQVQAEAIGVKTQGGLVGRAWALMLRTRLGLAGAVSPPP